jgi:hypothetical protein
MRKHCEAAVSSKFTLIPNNPEVDNKFSQQINKYSLTSQSIFLICQYQNLWRKKANDQYRSTSDIMKFNTFQRYAYR